MNQFWSKENIEKKFLNTRKGDCKQGYFARTEQETFKIIKLPVPASNTYLSLNNMISNHYSENTDTLMMKCSDCCPHKKICPQTGKCKLMKAVSQRCLTSTPKYLYIQLQSFASHDCFNVETKVTPENLLVLPNEDKYKLISIANHLGTQIRWINK